MGDLGKLVHALVVVDALRLHLGERPALGVTLLSAEHLIGVLERGFHHRDEVKVVGVALWVEQLQGCQQEGRERLVEGEVLG